MTDSPESDASVPDASQSAADGGAADAPSPIWLENMREGVRHEEPDKLADGQVEGYTSAVSAAAGDTIQLFVNVDHAQAVRWDLYRVGYYAGRGMRLVAQSERRPVSVQPACPTDPSTGMIECDWHAAFDVTIDPDWVSGYYVFELINDDGFGSRVPLIVREGSRRAQALAQASVNTWQAYNRWGGISIYKNKAKDGPYKQDRGHRVSFDRPYRTQNEQGPFLNMVRFLERHGYDISYTTNIDIEADPSVLADRKLFMTLAHDEYWTIAQRAALDAARDRGLSLAFFSANTGYLRVRLGPSTRGVPRRTLTCYKSSTLDPVKNAPDTTANFADEPFAHPENALLGVAYRTWSKVPGYPYIVTNADHWLYAGTGVRNNDALANVVGAEWDGVVDNGQSPDGLEILARAVTIDDDGAFGDGDANLTVYSPTPHSFVFAAGSIYWSNGLSPGPFADARIERMSENVLAHAGLVSAIPLTEPSRAQQALAPFESKVLAGSGDAAQTDGPALQAALVAPVGIVSAPDGTLYVVDRGDSAIRVLSREGKLSSIASNRHQDFATPIGLAMDRHGTLYLSDSLKHRIFKVTTDGKSKPYAGTGKPGAHDDTDPLQASFSGPRALTIGPDDALYVADSGNNAIRRIDASGVSTVATDQRFVSGVAVGPDGAVYFAAANSQIGVVRDGKVTILANVAGIAGNREGPAEQAQLQPQEGMLVDGDRLLFTDTENNRVRALSLKGPHVIRTVYGDGNAAPDARDSRHTWLPRGIARFDGGFAVTDFGSRRVLWFREATEAQ